MARTAESKRDDAATGSPRGETPEGHLDRVLPGLAEPMRTDGQAIRDALAALRRAEQAPDRCKVAVIGRFKAGKSQLINALVETEILPRNTDECTTRCTELRYHEEPAFLKEAEDGEQPISEEEFLAAVDRTQDESGAVGPQREARYVACLPHPLLRTVSLMDTPGYDGNSEYREIAIEAIEAAAEWADLCLFVVTATKIGELQMKFVERILPRCPSVVLVINRSDELDSEFIEEIGRQLDGEIAEILNRRLPRVFVSGLWQQVRHATSGPELETREHILHLQDLLDEPGEPLHQWDTLLHHLLAAAEASAEERRFRRLDRVGDVLETIRRFDTRFDPRAQAGHDFLARLDVIRPKMPPPIGVHCLQTAIRAAETGQPLPWERLANFGVTPELVSPRVTLMPSLGAELVAEYLELAGDLARDLRLAWNRERLITIRRYVQRLGSDFLQLEEMCRELDRLFAWLAFWSPQEFNYEQVVSQVKERWSGHPAGGEQDLTRVRTQLMTLVTELQALADQEAVAAGVE